MLLMVVMSMVAVALVAILLFAALRVRRRQRQLLDRQEASQLQRRADHLFKIALAAQVHTRDNAIAEVLLQEAIAVLMLSARLDPSLEAVAISLRECQALLATTEQQLGDPESPRDALLDFPETELIEAQLHLTEASRLLMGFERRGLVLHEQLAAMLAELKQAQRALDLRLQLRRAADSTGMQRTVEQAVPPQPGGHDHSRSGH